MRYFDAVGPEQEIFQVWPAEGRGEKRGKETIIML